MYIHKTGFPRDKLLITLPRYIQTEEFTKALESYGLRNVAYAEKCFSFDAMEQKDMTEVLNFIGFILRRAKEQSPLEWYVCLHNFVNEWRQLNGNIIE